MSSGDQDFPTMNCSMTASNSYGGQNWDLLYRKEPARYPLQFIPETTTDNSTSAIESGLRRFVEHQSLKKASETLTQEIKKLSSRRLVTVYIADTDSNVPVEKCLLYKSDSKLTDLTDQELYFEINIKELLDKHNEYRKTLVDKKQSEKFGREVKLEAVRIRDLAMTVSVHATF